MDIWSRDLAPVIGTGTAGVFMTPIEFDKDNDDHMKVIASCANLRGRNYKIPEADFHTTR